MVIKGDTRSLDSSSCRMGKSGGFFQTRGTFLGGGSIMRSIVFLGSILGSPYFGKLPNGKDNRK